VIDHVKPFPSHFADSVDIDWFKDQVLDYGKDVRYAIRLTSSGIDDARVAVFFFAGLKDGQRTCSIHAQIAEGILHGLDMTDVSCKVENVCALANESLHECDVARVTFNDFQVIFNRIEIEVVGSARCVEVVDDYNIRSESYELNCDVASDEAEAAGD